MRLEVAAGIVIWIVVALLAERRFGASGAYDLRPIYLSGVAVRTGSPIYDVPEFVYPPFAALVAVPLSLLRYPLATHVYSVIQIIFPVGAVAWLGSVLFQRHKILASGIFGLILLKSDVFVNSLFVFNPGLLFILPLVAIIICWSAGHWKTGVVVLAISVAFKPLLILLFLLPLLRRRWPDVTLGVAVTAILTFAGIMFSHDFRGLLRLPDQILTGTNLHGPLQSGNISLSSIGIIYPSFGWPLYALRISLVFLAALALWRSRSWRLTLDLTGISTGMLALVLPVCGSISEIHYSLLGLPAAAILLLGRQGRLPQFLAGCGILLLCAPLHNLHLPNLSDHAAQLRWGIGQATILVACITSSLRATNDLGDS